MNHLAELIFCMDVGLACYCGYLLATTIFSKTSQQLKILGGLSECLGEHSHGFVSLPMHYGNGADHLTRLDTCDLTALYYMIQ